MSDGPKFYWQLDNVERGDGFGGIMESELAIVNDGYQPCDGCGRIHYTEETACEFPDPGMDYYGRPWQHCNCWYECEPCCKCEADAVVLYGPKPPYNETIE